MTYLGHCDLERSIAPTPTVQYSYFVAKRALLSCLLIFFNENLKKSYIIQNLNISLIEYLFKISQIESNIKLFHDQMVMVSNPMHASRSTYNLQAAICFGTAQNSQNAIRDFS